MLDTITEHSLVTAILFSLTSMLASFTMHNYNLLSRHLLMNWFVSSSSYKHNLHWIFFFNLQVLVSKGYTQVSILALVAVILVSLRVNVVSSQMALAILAQHTVADPGFLKRGGVAMVK